MCLVYASTRVPKLSATFVHDLLVSEVSFVISTLLRVS